VTASSSPLDGASELDTADLSWPRPGAGSTGALRSWAYDARRVHSVALPLAAGVLVYQLRDRKIKIGVWIRFVPQRVVPPLAVVRAETAGLHDGTKVLTVSRFDFRDSFCSVM
jgi:hypothetical protein